MRFLRRWWWAILVVVVLVVRAVLPEVLRGQIETRASEALKAKVQVGDVDLGILGGAVALDDVAVRALDAPPEEQPLLAWKRFAVDVRWLPLLWKTIRFATIELVEPDVAVDRLQSGELNLMALVPKSEEEKPAEDAAAEPSGWKVGIDYLALRRGGLYFRDFLIPDAEPMLLSLQSIEVRDISLEPEVYGAPADIKFVAKLEGGALRTRARFTPRKEGMAVDVTVDGTRIPVKRSRVYVPGVAWSELTGLLSLSLRYRLETGGRNELSGAIRLDDLTVWTASLDQPSLTWKSLAVALEKVDLAKHEARVKRVALAGVVLPVKPRDREPVPVIAAARAAEEAAKTQAADAKPEEIGPAWRWHVDDVSVVDSTARLLSDTPPLDVGLTLDVKRVSGPQHETSPLKIDLAIEDGKVGIDGTLRLAPIGVGVAVQVAALDVPRLVGATGAIPPGVLQVAKLDADLKVVLGSAAPTAGDAVVSGTATVGDLWIEAYDPKEFSAGAKRIAVDVQDVTVPGALAAGPVRDRGMSIALRTVDVESLYARVTRTETGIVLPAFTSAPPAKPAAGAAATPAPPPPAPAPEGAPEAKPAAATEPAAAPAAGSEPTLAIDAVKLVKGRVDLTDRTVKPFYWTAYDPIDGELRDVRQPPLEIASIRLVAVNTKKGVIEVKGGLTKKSDIELVVKELPLMPFNPYVTGMSPYSISRGSLFVTTKASIDGPSYKTTTWLTLTDFDLSSRSGKHVVLEQLGVPLTVAVALLRDWKGNIDLTIPVDMDEKGTQIGLGTVVTGALVRALVGTLTSPLKVVGFVLPRGGSGAGESLAPVPITFVPGLAVLGSAGGEQVKQLAEFLAGRPGLGVTLSAPPTPADVRGMREQALLAQLGPRKGVIGNLRNVGARGRIVDALDARSRGEKVELEAEDAKALDEYLEEIPAPTPEQLRKLGDERLAIVEKSLRADYGIGDNQISRLAEPDDGTAEGEPGVRVDLGSAKP